MKVFVNLLGFGFSEKDVYELKEGASCGSALDFVIKRSGRTSEDFGSFIYILNKKRAFEDTKLKDGDELIISAILGGG